MVRAFAGGGGGSRTPVRKPIHGSFYMLSRSSDLPQVCPVDRKDLWQLFKNVTDYRALIRNVGCCVTPKPKPQHSSAGRAALRQLMHILQNLRLNLNYPLLRSLGELRMLNPIHDPRRNLYAPGMK